MSGNASLKPVLSELSAMMALKPKTTNQSLTLPLKPATSTMSTKMPLKPAASKIHEMYDDIYSNSSFIEEDDIQDDMSDAISEEDTTSVQVYFDNVTYSEDELDSCDADDQWTESASVVRNRRSVASYLSLVDTPLSVLPGSSDNLHRICHSLPPCTTPLRDAHAYNPPRPARCGPYRDGSHYEAPSLLYNHDSNPHSYPTTTPLPPTTEQPLRSTPSGETPPHYAYIYHDPVDKNYKIRIFSKHFLIACTVVSILLNIASGYCLVAMVMKMSNGTAEEATFPEGSYEICVSCDKLGYKETTVYRVDNGVTKCCVSDSLQMSRLFKQMIQTTPLETENVPNSRPVTPNTHQYFTSVHKDSLHELVMGMQTVSRSDENPVAVYRDHVSVTSSGWYYVYSGVTQNNATCSHVVNKTWHHRIVLAPGETLVNATRTCCDDCNPNMQSSYTGGLFYLKEGSNVSVILSEVKNIEVNFTDSYLGLVRLAIDWGY
ncbi:uncharacterized protein LOC131942655 [Physella acuta]|uniref:uncharacterized protein LOC131942655 n=1 Tax=Physella acuta TaxID=109671 RepID=UPI0027DAFF3E|nr:uncharacterized protein LOC131942655 [Physella acuta]XP_059158537.1 uncharacterized protein LOC131942655 [Physella acuta]